MFIFYNELVNNVVYCINTNLKMVALKVQYMGKIQYGLKWKGFSRPRKQ